MPGSDPGGVAVAILSTGVNYVLPALAARLARDGEGDIAGLDFVDRDNRPYDAAAVPAPAGAHLGNGTALASIVLAEAPRARLVPVRLGLADPRQLGGAAAFVAASPARIAVVALAGEQPSDWEAFRQAAIQLPQVLFILPAGDAARDLDAQPLFPASFGLANCLVVTASDADGRLLAASNRGEGRVDLAVPAERLTALGADGLRAEVTGTAYAAARVAALAARLSTKDARLGAGELKARILALALPLPHDPRPRPRHGWIAQPDTAE